MSGLPNSGGQPSATPAPLSTPGAASQPKPTPNADHSGSSTSWSTIPGLGSAVRPPEATPPWASKGGPPLASVGAPVSLRKTSSLTIDSPTVTAGRTSRALGAVPKTAGAAPVDWHSFMDKRPAMSTATTTGVTSTSLTSSFPLQGLGGAAHSFNGSKAAPSGAKTAPVHFTQTEEYHNSASPVHLPVPSPVPIVAPPQTAPLPQTGFPTFSDRPVLEKDDSSSGLFTEPTSSEASIGLKADNLLKHRPEHGGAQAPTWKENSNPRGLRHALRDPTAEWEESYVGALHALSLLNPDQYVMPYGTRVINIKTDYPSNILASIREGKYAVIEKVAERIMTIYTDRVDPHEKVLFLFSVNASKKFCGLAEMSGEWDSAGSIEKWSENAESARVYGTIPVRWIYAKDVAYYHFSHIRQIHNGHPVGNMWNGMNFPGETGREVIQHYVATPSTASILGLPKNYPENVGVRDVRGTDGSSDTRSSASQRSRGSFVARGASRGGRGMSRVGLNIPHWRPQNSDTDEEFEDDPTPTAANAGRERNFSTDRKLNTVQNIIVKEHKAAPTFSMDDLKNAPVAGNATVLPGEPVSFVMGQDGRLMVVPSAKAPTAEPTATARSSVFDEAPVRRNRGGMGSQGRGGDHAADGRPLHNGQPSYATRPLHGHQHSPSVAMLHQAAMFAAQQEARTRNQYRPAPFNHSWDYHPQQMASSGFQDDRSYLSRSRTGHEVHMRHDNEDEYDVLPTPTHRPPPHATRQDPSNDGFPNTYRSVPGWQSDVIQGMGHLQLKAFFFTLAAEQHILEYQSMQPSVSSYAMDTMRVRIRRIVELKREVYDELYFIGHTLFDHPFDGEDFNPYQQPASYPSQQRISPVRDDNGRILASASETSRSPPDIWGMQFPPSVQSHSQHSAQLHGHQQQQSMQSSAASMMGGGVDLHGSRVPS